MSRRAAALPLLLIVSCSSAGVAPQRPTSPLHVETHASSGAPPPADPSATRLQQRIGGALAYMSQIRGLAATSSVAGRLIGRTEIQRYISAQIDDETPPDVLAATEALLYGFGTVDQQFNYRTSIINLMSSQLLGFYDPKQKTFFVGGDLEGEEADVTLWHELVHALQDQHYDLSHLTDWQPDAGDSQAAVHALAEGDATSAMLDAMLKPRGATALELPEGLMRTQSMLGSAVSGAPPVLVRSLLAPYVDGLAFTNYLRRHGGFAAVDQAWQNLPTSTEQLLHPEKFMQREAPLAVEIPSGPAAYPDLKERFHDVMGEQTVRILLEEWLPSATAAAAASDWGGDRLSVFADDARKSWALAWHLRFDSPAAAERSFIAFARSLPLTELGTPHPALAEAAPGRHWPTDKLCRRRHIQGPIAVVRHAADLAIVIGPFGRQAGTTPPDSDCQAALEWAQRTASD